MSTASGASKPAEKAPLWVSNMIFFLGMHAVALLGAFKLSPWWELRRETFGLCIASWQLATFGITVGYHRLWSHKSFSASFPLRVVLAGMGCLGFQGSIRWWVLRHRLHHRFTDSESDPYNASEGLYHSHMGWIFRKPVYPRMGLIDKRDLDTDPVVRFQHKYYIPLTLGLGLVLPAVIGWSYGDTLGGFLWGGVIARIMIWHFTFFINSLAHYLGDQAYSEDVTARGNFFLAIFTGGEANHNYHHAFPTDYRNGPRAADWDPTKWLIYLLHHFTPLVPHIKQTPEAEILRAKAHVLALQADRKADDPASSDGYDSSFSRWSSYASATSEDNDGATTASGSSGGSEAEGDEAEVDALLDGVPLQSTLLASGGANPGRRRRSFVSRTSSANRSKKALPVWTHQELLTTLAAAEDAEGSRKPLLLLINGFAVDATAYARDHPGGVAVMREYAVKRGKVVDATEGFEGGQNDHGWSAREKLKSLRVARVIP